jgi:hypothetical protein
MEGSRHEKAALVSVAYLIGALTIFIGSATQNSATVSFVETSAFMPTTQTASVVSALPVDTAVPALPKSVVPADSSVSYYQGKLTYETPAGRKILSFNPEVSGVESSPEFEKQGMHSGDLIFAVSSDDAFVFFCERKADPRQCTPFIFDRQTETIYPVTQNSKLESLTLAVAAGAVWDNGLLNLPGLTSVAEGKPWLLLGKN